MVGKHWSEPTLVLVSGSHKELGFVALLPVEVLLLTAASISHPLGAEGGLLDSRI